MVKIKSKKTSTKTSNKIDASNSENKQTLNSLETLQESQSDLSTFFKKPFEKFELWLNLKDKTDKTSSVKIFFSLLAVLIIGLIASPFIISIIVTIIAIIFSLFISLVAISISFIAAGIALIVSGVAIIFRPSLLYNSSQYITINHFLASPLLIGIGCLFVALACILGFGIFKCFQAIWKNIKKLSNNN